MMARNEIVARNKGTSYLPVEKEGLGAGWEKKGKLSFPVVPVYF